MTRVDLHPDPLFDRLRDGRLSDEERARLHAHCSYCDACRFELRLVEGAHVAADESARDAQLAAAALRGLSLERAPLAQARSAHPQSRVWALAWVGAALVLGCTMGAAAMVTHYPERLLEAVSDWFAFVVSRESALPRARSHQAPVDPQRSADVFNPPARASAAVTALAPGLVAGEAMLATRPGLAPGGRPRAAQRSGVGVNAAPRASAQGAPVAREHARERVLSGRAAHTQDPKAEAALGLATQARARGQGDEAFERYRLVIEHYPASRAANMARIALGRLLYAELSQPAAALAWFDAYLAQNERGELAEEALYYRARCLVRLHRIAEARASFHELLDVFPDSLYAAQARAHLASGRAP